MSFAYATSHRIDEAAGGLLRKDLSEEALIGDARRVRLPFVHAASREPAVYRHLLGTAGIGPRCVSSGQDWILVEHVDGVGLWQVGEPETWVAVAAWVAAMHRRLAAVSSGAPVGLLVHDRWLAGLWRDRAAAAGVPRQVLAAHERASERLLGLPATIIHGDLYPSNVLVRPRSAGAQGSRPLRVWPIDWELAGIGPAVLDVAALTSGGGWSPSIRTAMAHAYFRAAGEPGGSWGQWSRDLDAARLYLCVQWLGSLPGWTPPLEHRYDWLAEALCLVEEGA